ncbi:hypothetical protein F383_19651 [Gossypium arboreum]|uniref:Uncharacterized protein n=1 Tax=Gossypium arboreum TaxID=29729 RepID=A0A0B0NMN0_GOSAR|nr:hypothetical protein F383_19651 [Gossypium arboreum]
MALSVHDRLLSTMCANLIHIFN